MDIPTEPCITETSERGIIEFRLTEAHITLASRLAFHRTDPNLMSMGSAISTSACRPYGKSAVIGDMAEILSLQIPDPESGSPEKWRHWNTEVVPNLDRTQSEMHHAVTIILSAQTFIPGIYRNTSPYSYAKWAKVGRDPNLPVDCDCDRPPPTHYTEGVWRVSNDCPIHG